MRKYVQYILWQVFYENYTNKFITIQILFQVIVLICLIVGSTFRDIVSLSGQIGFEQMKHIL